MTKASTQAATPPASRFPSYKALIKHFDAMPDHIQRHFPHLRDILNNQLPLEIPIAYLFLKIELACNRSLYGGVVKVHTVDSKLARRVINQQHLTRQGFKDLFFNIFGEHPDGQSFIDRAEKTRDRVIHGKQVESATLRECIGDSLDFCLELHQQIQGLANFTPFGDMRGFAAKLETLDRRTSKWVMKGMGFGVK